MKRIVISMCFVLFLASGSVCSAQSRGVAFECVSPVDVVKGAGCYLFDASERVLRGVGNIVTAPFKAKLCIPERKRYMYIPPKWTPGSLKPYPKRDTVPIPLHIEIGPEKPPEIKPQKFYRPLYYSPKNNSKIALRGASLYETRIY